MKFGTGLVAAVAFTALMAMAAYAQQRDLRWGTSAAPVPSAKPAIAKLKNPPPQISGISPSATYYSANFASGGVALRNRTYGIVQISGVSGAVQAAYVYWAVITQGAPKTPNQSVKLGAFYPGSSSTVTVAGTQIGTGPTPCWLGNQITVYRGALTGPQLTTIFAAGGNGLFQVTLLAKASGVGTKANGDPFFALPNGQPNSPLPEMEGASLVVIGTGSNIVSIFDNGLAAQEFTASDGLAYQLNLPTSAAGASQVLFDEIGADGQMFAGDGVDTDTSSKVTSINSTSIAGTGAPDPLPDWDGLAGSPIPQLWDDTVHDITSAATGSTLAVTITSDASGDCLATVANIVSLALGE